MTGERAERPTGQSGRGEAKGAFLSRLAEGALLADGAMGTLLHGRGASLEIGFELLNVTQKDCVQKAHLDYLLAGAELIETNTYAANRSRLRRYGLEEQTWEINVWGAKIARAAREIAGEPAWIAGAVGPLDVAAGPGGRALKPDEVRALYREQMEALLAGGVDLFVIETMADPDQAAEAVRAARQISKLPVMVAFAFWPDGSPDGQHGRNQFSSGELRFATGSGVTPEEVGAKLNALEPTARPDVIGVNCGSGVAHLPALLEPLKQVVSFDVYWSAMPNAGQPAYVGGRMVYMATPEYVADSLLSLRERGVRLVGGCCGTTPEHIAALRERLSGDRVGVAPSRASSADGEFGATDGPSGGVRETSGAVQGEAPHGQVAQEAALMGPAGSPVEVRPRRGVRGVSRTMASDGAPQTLADKLGRQFVISVELDPPRGPGVKKYLQTATALRDAGVDAINVADSPMARVRMSAVAAAHLIQDRVGVESIIHFTTRDRNLMAIQSDLLGAHALGIRNVIALTGDPPSLGNVTRAAPVYNIDSIGLVQTLTALNAGTDVGGNPMGRPTDFTVACALSPNADDPDREGERFRQKLDAGAHFVMTQPLYELDPLRRALDAAGGCDRPIILGVMPLHSFKHAEYLHNEVPGISIPARFRRELQLAGDDGLRMGLEQAAEIVQEARPWIAGVYVVLSFGKHEPICDFVGHIRALTDAEDERWAQ